MMNYSETEHYNKVVARMRELDNLITVVESELSRVRDGEGVIPAHMRRVMLAEVLRDLTNEYYAVMQFLDQPVFDDAV